MAGAIAPFSRKEPFTQHCPWDRLQYAGLHAALQRGAEVRFCSPDGMLATRNGQHFLAGKVDLTPFLPEIQLLLVHEESLADSLLASGAFSEQLTCLQAVYLPHDPPAYRIDGLSFRVLTMDDFSFVHGHYHTGRNSQSSYIKTRLINGDLMGGFVGNQCAGFVGIHREGAIGMLEVLPDFRRRGIGMALEAEMIRRLLNQKFLPYCHVFPDNVNSLSLQQKLGLSIAPRPIHWVC